MDIILSAMKAFYKYVMTKIIAIVRGGVLQQIITNTRDLEFTVIDYDSKTAGQLFPDSIMTGAGVTEYIEREAKLFILTQITHARMQNDYQDGEYNETDDYTADIEEAEYVLLSITKKFAGDCPNASGDRDSYHVADYRYSSRDRAYEDVQFLKDQGINITEAWEKNNPDTN